LYKYIEKERNTNKKKERWKKISKKRKKEKEFFKKSNRERKKRERCLET